MTFTRLTLLAALSSLLAACTSQPSPPSAVPESPAESTAGTWRGSSTRFQADSRTCPHPGLVTLRVLEDRFQYHWDTKAWVDATIDPDGTTHGEGPDITLIGKRAGKRLEGDITNGACGLHFTVIKQDN